MKDLMADLLRDNVLIKSAEDVDHLEEYADDLFGHIDNPTDAEEAMRGLIQVVHHYRNEFTSQTIDLFKGMKSDYRSKHSKDKNLQAMQDKAKELIRLMGGDNIGTMPGNAAKEVLRDIITSTEKYILSSPRKPKPNKQPIEEYLKKIGTPHETRMIFIYNL